MTGIIVTALFFTSVFYRSQPYPYFREIALNEGCSMGDLYTENETFEKNDFSAEGLSGEYESCSFVNCDLSNAGLSGIRFFNSEFVDCNLSNATLDGASFQDVVFRNCKMLGLQFERCNHIGFSVRFENCILSHSTFFKMKLNGTAFNNSQLHHVDFVGAEMKKVSLKNCDLLNAQFENSNLEGADFTSSTNYSIDPEKNRLKGARFSVPEVIGLLNKYGIRIASE